MREQRGFVWVYIGGDFLILEGSFPALPWNFCDLVQILGLLVSSRGFFIPILRIRNNNNIFDVFVCEILNQNQNIYR